MRKEEDRIGILLGGPSNEREISIKSGKAVYEALCSQGYDAVCIDPKDVDSVKRDILAEKIDLAFIALHGRFGEDGTIQSILEGMNIPYTGSGPQASRLAMNKALSRKVFEKDGIPVPRYKVISKGTGPSISLGTHPSKVISKGTHPSGSRYQFERDTSPFKYPFVVKPVNEGSSIGMNIVENNSAAGQAIEEAFSYDDEILIEEYIDGEDITVGILGEKPLPVVHIKPKDKFYSFNAKYTDGMSVYEVPAVFADEVLEEAQRLGLLAHQALGCRSFSRVDMILDEEKRVIVLEVNTIPGLTSSSLLPKAAEAIGINFTQMCLNMVESAKTGV